MALTASPTSTASSTATTTSGAPRLPAFAASIDTMKESRDTETRPLTDAQIADDVNLCASLNTTYITVDTHWDYPDYMQRWVNAIRAAGKHVWFRIAPNQWEDNNGTTGIMSPAQFESAEQTFLAAYPSLVQPGDILDIPSEPENGLYWKSTYGSGWTYQPAAPNTATQAFNAFIRDTSAIADTTLHAAGIYGVITGVRSVNSYFATHPGTLEPATVSALGYVTFDSYPEGLTTDPTVAAQDRLSEIQAVALAWPGVPIVLGEMGYSNKVLVDDATQEAVVAAELQAISPLSYIAGVNYWVGAGTSNSGGYTHIFAGSTGNWSLRPAALDLSSFFQREVSAPPAIAAAAGTSGQSAGSFALGPGSALTTQLLSTALPLDTTAP